MRYKFLLLLLLAGYLSSGQSGNLVKVPGTKCSLIPPAGFEPSSSFGGFQNAETGASIMINEIPAPYQEMVDGFTEEALKARGMTLTSKEPIDFNHSKATMIRLNQAANGITYLKQILIFGV